MDKDTNKTKEGKMQTADKSIEAWLKGNKTRAYNLYCEDDGSLILSFKEFCHHFPKIIKLHESNLQSEANHRDNARSD